MSRPVGGRCPGAAANGESRHLSRCGITGQGGTGCLAMPVVVAQEERPLVEAMTTAVGSRTSSIHCRTARGQ